MTGVARICVAIQNLFDFGTLITLASIRCLREDARQRVGNKGSTNFKRMN